MILSSVKCQGSIDSCKTTAFMIKARTEDDVVLWFFIFFNRGHGAGKVGALRAAEEEYSV
jgi:hypothetical protein